MLRCFVCAPANLLKRQAQLRSTLESILQEYGAAASP